MSGELLVREILDGDIKSINIDLQLLPNTVRQTGVVNVTQTIDKYSKKVKDERIDDEYYVVAINRQALVLEGTPNKIPRGRFIGVVFPLSTELRNRLTAYTHSPVLSYGLSDKGMMGHDAFLPTLFAFLLLCSGLILVIRQLNDREDKNHYIYEVSMIAGYENFNDLSIDFANTSRGKVIYIGGYTLSDKFLYRENYFSFKIYPISQMYWAYKKVVKKSINFIPMGKDYELVMHFRPNKTVSITEPETAVHNHLLHLTHLCPNAEFGYTK